MTETKVFIFYTKCLKLILRKLHVSNMEYVYWSGLDHEYYIRKHMYY